MLLGAALFLTPSPVAAIGVLLVALVVPMRRSVDALDEVEAARAERVMVRPCPPKRTLANTLPQKISCDIATLACTLSLKLTPLHVSRLTCASTRVAKAALERLHPIVRGQCNGVDGQTNHAALGPCVGGTQVLAHLLRATLCVASARTRAPLDAILDSSSALIGTLGSTAYLP